MFDKQKYDQEYHKTYYDRLAIVTPKGTKERVKRYCEAHGTTINGLINDYLDSLGLRAGPDESNI